VTATPDRVTSTEQYLYFAVVPEGVMDWTFEPVAGPYDLTEGPIRVPDERAVYFTDIPSSRILRYDVATDEVEAWTEDTDRGNGLALGPDGAIYCCEMEGHRVSRYARDGSKTVVASEYGGKRLTSPNDLYFDSAGRLWFTDPDYDDQADAPLDHRSVYRIDDPPGGEPVRVTHDTTNPNGLLVSPDEETLYVAQSEYGPGNPRELRAYPLDADGEAGSYEVLHNFYPHRGIDGMALDEDGNLVATAGWAESGPGPMLYVFTPAGRVLETHPAPGGDPTNCCFAGEDLTDLYVTGKDGFLYRAETDRVGFEIPP
jgi:gluconolactonase